MAETLIVTDRKYTHYGPYGSEEQARRVTDALNEQFGADRFVSHFVSPPIAPPQPTPSEKLQAELRALGDLGSPSSVAQHLVYSGVPLACDKSISGLRSENCPLAQYLTNAVGRAVSVDGRRARLGQIGEEVDLPENVREFVRFFDVVDQYYTPEPPLQDEVDEEVPF